jgi:hypothetical protein
MMWLRHIGVGGFAYVTAEHQRKTGKNLDRARWDNPGLLQNGIWIRLL